MRPMIKLLSQFEQVANATPFALRGGKYQYCTESTMSQSVHPSGGGGGLYFELARNTFPTGAPGRSQGLLLTNIEMVYCT